MAATIAPANPGVPTLGYNILKPAVANSSFGTNLHDEDPDIPALLKAGIKCVRVDFVWRLIQTKNGFDPGFLARLDNIVNKLYNAGIRIAGNVGGNNPDVYYTDAERKLYSQPHPELGFVPQPWNPIWDGMMPTRADNIAGFITLVEFLVKRYQGKGIFWGCWNEPNLNQFFGPVSDPLVYTKLLRLFYLKVKQISLKEMVSGMVLCCDWQGWAETCLQHGAINCMDVWDHHCYVGSDLPETIIKTHWQPMYALMKKYGRILPIIASEICWSLRDLIPYLDTDEEKSIAILLLSGNPDTTLADKSQQTLFDSDVKPKLRKIQADFMRRLYIANIAAQSKLGIVIAYTLWYMWPNDPNEQGMIDTNGKPLPVYDAMCALKAEFDAWGTSV